MGVMYSNKRFSCPVTIKQDVVSKAQTRTYVLRRHISIIGTSCGRGGESACVIVRIKGNESCHITFCFSELHFLGWRCCTFCKILVCLDNSLSKAERNELFSRISTIHSQPAIGPLRSRHCQTGSY
jgi:hypothetical protein